MSDLLLDTHIFIWLLTGDLKLQKKNLDLIEKSLDCGFRLCLSSISIWEIAMLENKKRIMLSSPIAHWVDSAINTTSARIMELTPDIMIDSCNLPGAFHPDPADRLIVSTSRVHNIPLITQDERILDYIRSGFVPIVDEPIG